ncbi:MAG: TetR family transcriptional regulator, partial [Sneathiella sp.]
IVLLLDGAFASTLIHRDPDYVLEAGRTAKMLIKNS